MTKKINICDLEREDFDDKEILIRTVMMHTALLERFSEWCKELERRVEELENDQNHARKSH